MYFVFTKLFPVMFKLIPIERRLCELGNSYDFIADACRTKTEDCTFLGFRLSGPWNNLWCGFGNNLAYLLFVLILVLVLLYQIYNLMDVYFSKDLNPPTRWRGNNGFSVVPPPWVRRLGLVQGFVNINVCGLLLYAAIYESPALMYPWLLVRVSELIFNVVAATFNYIIGLLLVRTIFSLILHVLCTGIVYKTMWALCAARKKYKGKELFEEATF
nr:uncharacterized protein LOC108085501 [Drosophila kikkawai]